MCSGPASLKAKMWHGVFESLRLTRLGPARCAAPAAWERWVVPPPSPPARSWRAASCAAGSWARSAAVCGGLEGQGEQLLRALVHAAGRHGRHRALRSSAPLWWAARALWSPAPLWRAAHALLTCMSIAAAFLELLDACWRGWHAAMRRVCRPSPAAAGWPMSCRSRALWTRGSSPGCLYWRPCCSPPAQADVLQGCPTSRPSHPSLAFLRSPPPQTCWAWC